MTELQQTKNSFKFIGKVTRFDKDGAFKEEQSTKGKREGDTFRSLRFGVKTSENNDMTVQMFDYEPTEVFLWNSDKKKKNPNYKGDRIAFDKWEKQQEKLRNEGYSVLQTRIGLTHDESGKIVSKGLPSFVASDEIFHNLDNGDSVVVEGEIRYSTYKNRDDKLVEQKSFNIKKVFRLKDIDFDSERFEEVTYFEQEMVFVDADIDKKEKKAHITGRIIDYAKNYHDTQFVVDYSADGRGNGTDESMVKMAEAFKKKIKFGDVLKVFGNAVNRVIIEAVEGEDDDEDLLADLGGKSKPSHANYTAKTYISEMQIHGIEALDKKVYTEDDFIKDDLIDEKPPAAPAKDDDDDFGGKKKPNSNPFEDDDEDGDDALPF